ncbi:MAG TPA: hypothetical protein VL860_03220, partial [Planctomycetota bacterium]|nr:hypothetical protein [Planctomycetota bacterium]
MTLSLPPFRRTQIVAPTLDAVRAASADWEVMLITILDALLTRAERHPEYPFIDSKLSLLTGMDNYTTPVADESRDFKGPTALYGWIQ